MIRNYEEVLLNLRGVFDLPVLQNRLQQIERELQKSSNWDSTYFKNLLKERAQISERLELFEDLSKEFRELIEWYNFYKEERSWEVLEEFLSFLHRFERKLKTQEMTILLGEEYDHLSAILSLHAGTGGTDAQDWAYMLLRMYTRWAEKKGYKFKIVDILPGEEAGIKSALLMVEGPWAFGYLKGEKGIHRLIRISPFDANSRRHTSFASVTVIPQIEEDVEVEIRPEDIKIETMRASGHGGQHVNKTETAVRITHLPTGIVVTCQNERSQYLNKMTGLKILKARLYQLEKQKLEQKKETLIGEKKEISWGNQIRTYILHPYKVVKDHRTQYEAYKVEAILDGEIDELIREYLIWLAKGNIKERKALETKEVN
ncbi:MAG: peptide chain release factor 2 [Thermodesulfobacteriaceae bacterium]|nr:peptide chain release factor 2 [Thermodesulfobacteriaceae bacterium]MDW8135169.1 peptide chain release factor 2 [Thermodesulfobacterium sp.]